MSRAESAAAVVASLRGLQVTQLRLDYALELVLDQSHGVRIEAPYTLRRGEQTWVIDPKADPSDSAPTLSVARSTVADAQLGVDGSLSLRFTDGMIIEVPADERSYERWTLYGTDGRLVVGGPAERITMFPPPDST